MKITAFGGHSQSVFTKRVMLVFFDAAGEHFDNADTMENMNRYIYNASGIICLLDPLQLAPVRQEVARNNLMDPALFPTMSTEQSDLIARLNEVIRTGYLHKNRRISGQIPVPLALVFSKVDALRSSDPCHSPLLLGEDSAIFRPSNHQGVLYEQDVIDIDRELNAWLTQADPASGIINCCQGFKKSAFFGCSALGLPPTLNGLSCAPNPIRVEDPFLWLLAQNGLITVAKSK